MGMHGRYMCQLTVDPKQCKITLKISETIRLDVPNSIQTMIDGRVVVTNFAEGTIDRELARQELMKAAKDYCQKQLSNYNTCLDVIEEKEDGR